MLGGLRIEISCEHLEDECRKLLKPRLSIVSIPVYAERLQYVKSKKRQGSHPPHTKRRHRDAIHDHQHGHYEDRCEQQLSCVEHCALGASGAPGGSVRSARLAAGVPTGRTGCADECAVRGRVPALPWSG